MANFGSKRALGLWQEASKIRQEWLDHGLSTQPADRQTAEHSLTMIYVRISRPRPHFEWVSSPAQALPLGVVLHRSVRIALHRSLARGFRVPVRTALAGDPARVPVCWYGQQEAPWIAYRRPCTPCWIIWNGSGSQAARARSAPTARTS